MAKKNPVNITEASESHEADILSRETRYLIAMAVRVVCFVLAIVCHGWLRWGFALSAVILPWIAVLIANNAAAPKAESAAAFTDVRGDDEIGTESEASGTAGPDEPDDDVVFGEIIRPLEAPRPDDHDPDNGTGHHTSRGTGNHA